MRITALFLLVLLVGCGSEHKVDESWVCPVVVEPSDEGCVTHRYVGGWVAGDKMAISEEVIREMEDDAVIANRLPNYRKEQR